MNNFNVDENTVITKSDGMTFVHIYIGHFDNLINVDGFIEWNIDFDDDTYIKHVGVHYHYLTLKEIADQLTLNNRHHIITIFIDGPMKTKIYQYGNYHNRWVMLGEVLGYA